MTVLAAGGVVWRPAERRRDRVEVAVVHRPKYDDWSLPKGKVDPGEPLVVTAVREVREETGHSAVCGRVLGTQRYRVAAGQKLVSYWTMSDPTGEFSAHEEVDKLAWLPPAQAVRRLSYTHDRKLVNAFADGPRATTTVLLVRHGRAGEKKSWPADDTMRPLDAAGREQAERLRPVAACYRPRRCVSAEPVRCLETVRPAAADLGLPVEIDPVIGKSGYDPKTTARWVRDQVAAGDPLLLCSQGEVIPDLVTTLAARSRVRIRDASARKGSLWALTFVEGGRLVGADYFDDLRPAA